MCHNLTKESRQTHLSKSLSLSHSRSILICVLLFSRCGLHGKTFWHFYWDTDKAFTVYNIYLDRESSKTFHRDFQLKCLHVCVRASMYICVRVYGSGNNETKRNETEYSNSKWEIFDIWLWYIWLYWMRIESEPLKTKRFFSIIIMCSIPNIRYSRQG